MGGYRAGACLLLLAFFLAACGQEATKGGQIVVGICEPDDLLPQNDLEICGSQVINNLFAGLIRYSEGKTAKPENVMAESITTDDQQTWTIEIKDGWTFHNGEAVTAKSYVDSWNFGAKPENTNSYYFANIKGYDAVAPAEGKATTTKLSGLRVVDNSTFEVSLSDRFSQFPVTLGFQAFFPLPSIAFKDIKAYREAPIGNGPYKMVGSWAHDEQIEVARYEDYPLSTGGPDDVEFRIFADTDAMYRELQANDLDLAIEVAEKDIQQAKKENPDGVVELTGISISFMGFPVAKPPFGNADVRRALSLAIDRQAIIDKILFGARKVAESFVPEAIDGSRQDACPYCSYDVAEAKELFAKAKGPKTLKIWFASDDPASKLIAEAVSNQWRSAFGIESTFETMPFTEFVEVLTAGEVDGPSMLGWFGDYPSPQNFLEPLFSTEGAANDVGYSNKAFDDLIMEGNRAANLDESIDAYQRAEDILLDKLPSAPLWYGVIGNVHGPRLSNVTFRSGVLDLTGVSVST